MLDHIVREQLLGYPQSLKQLGGEFKNGWSIAFYKGNIALIARSDQSSDNDANFDQAVEKASGARAKIIMGHLLETSSNCKDGLAKSYPYQRFHNGKNWLFSHHGSLSKELLISLISQEYLTANPPQACNDNPTESWADSELYFIYLLKKIDEAKGNVLDGLKNANLELSQHIKEGEYQYNFFLTDGKDVWAYKRGTSLFYTYDARNRLSIISTTVPGKDQFEWKEFPEGNFALLQPDHKPKFYTTTK